MKGGHDMQNISEEYLFLFNAVTTAEKALEQLRESLIAAQRQAEELYLQRTDGA